MIIASATMTPELEMIGTSSGDVPANSKPLGLRELVGPDKPATITVDDPKFVPKTLRGADLLVSMLASAGVGFVFGLPGGAISPVHDALLDNSIRVVTTKHEASAMFAAAGYAQATGNLGVVAVTSGPGALNAMTGLASAWCDGLPVLLLVGDVPRGSQGRGVLQDSSSHGLQFVEMSRHISKMAAEVASPSALPHMLRRAIATALSGRKGPVVLTLPIDVMTSMVTEPRIGGSMTMASLVEDDTLDEIAELLLAASRPLILAGSGVRGNGAPASLRAVAERFSCPVATTPKAKGVFPETHPQALGVLGLGGHRSARHYLDSGVDVVLAIGTSLGDLSTDGFAPALQASRALIHVDIDARQLGKSYSPTHAVVATAAELLGGLAERCGDLRPSERPLPNGVERHTIASSAKTDRIAPHDAIIELQSLLPSDTIYTVDSGEHFLYAIHYLEITHPDAFVVMTGLGSMGQSIGAAIGVQFAHPGRTVAAICGDGCFAMNAFEIATAVQEQLPIRVFVFNDERLGMVENGHQNVYGRRPRYPTGPLDICSIASGLGAATIRIDGKNQLDPVLLTSPGPVVIDVRIDPDVMMPKVDRVAVMATKPKVAPVAATNAEPSLLKLCELRGPMLLQYRNPQLFPDDTNLLPTSRSPEQQALLDDELEIGNESYLERLQQFSEVTENIYPELMAACRNVVAQAIPGKSLRVLDLCSGVGIVSLELLKAAFPIQAITLADMSPVLLERAAVLLQKRHGVELRKRVNTVVTDLLVDDLREKLSGTYDLIVTCNAFQHFPRERQAELFKQIHSLLATNGVFVFESHFKLLRPNWKQHLVAEYQARMRQQGAPEEFVLKAAIHINGFHNYVNLSEVYNWFEAAEFGFYECVFRKDEIGILAAVK